ncbi:MAG: thiamine-phosphate kinase [Candidatus Dormibacteria bacterium]
MAWSADAAEGPTVGDVGEAGLLQRLVPWLSDGTPALLVGPGDDAAVWQPPPGHALVTTTDSLVEGSHFLTPLCDNAAADLGWRLLAVSLSDLAAMGAAPGPVVISLALPSAWPVSWVEAIYRGLAECAAQFAAPLVGGNISAAASAVLSSTCVGVVEPSLVLRRDGAQAGWHLALTGPVGAAAAALRARASGGAIQQAWRTAARPVPRLQAGAVLARSGVRVAMDVSDGLFVDAGRLLQAAACSGLVLEASGLPVAPGIRDRWPSEWLRVAGGGEDYELLFAGPEDVVSRACDALRATGMTPAVIGAFDSGDGLRWREDGHEKAPPAGGHEHFRG